MENVKEFAAVDVKESNAFRLDHTNLALAFQVVLKKDRLVRRMKGMDSATDIVT